MTLIISAWAVRVSSKLCIEIKSDVSQFTCVFHRVWCNTGNLNNTMGPTRGATSDAGRAPKKQREVMMLQEKVELFDMDHRLRSAAAVATISRKMNPM